MKLAAGASVSQSLNESSSKDHPIPRKTGVTRHEAQSRLPLPVLLLRILREEKIVAKTRELSHILRRLCATTCADIKLWRIYMKQ